MEINLLKLLIMASKRLLYAFLVQVIAMQFIMATPSKSQNLEDVGLSISVQSKTFEEVLGIIQEKTLFNFTYNQKVGSVENQFTFSFQESNLKEVLQHLAQLTAFEFKRVNNTIYVKPGLSPENKVVELSHQPAAVNDAVDAYIPIEGTVVDEEGNPIPGATVIIEGTTNGTVTDIDGKFILDVGQGNVIKVSFIGYKSQSITVGNQTVYEITLIGDQAALEEVVVEGYGTQKKEDVTGAVSSV
ncbi:MAG: TonB-dependent receptor, partial [Cytophagales bacterium]|nr:TonB-dependent receptor [Cytophagales bacterium]